VTTTSDRTPPVTLPVALDRLLEELAPWRKALPQDIQHAHDRGLPHLEMDLRRLQAHVEATWKAARRASIEG
jgi:hypothetical protein